MNLNRCFGLAIILSGMVLLSGCTSITGNIAKTKVPGEENRLSTLERTQIKEALSTFYEELPKNKSKRLKVTETAADKICSDLETIDPDVFVSGAEVKRQSYRLKHAAEVINDNFNRHIEPPDIQDVIEGAGKIGKYATVVGPYNNFYDASCEVNKSRPTSVRRFYVTSFALGAELMMMQYGVYYKAGSKAARVSSHTGTFRMIQSKFGDDVLGSLMSEAHWFARESAQGASRFAMEELEEYGVHPESIPSQEELQSGLKEKYGLLADTASELIELLRDAEVTKKAQCLRDAVPFKSIGKVQKMLKDRKLSEDELDVFSKSVKDNLKDCLQR